MTLVRLGELAIIRRQRKLLNLNFVLKTFVQHAIMINYLFLIHTVKIFTHKTRFICFMIRISDY